VPFPPAGAIRGSRGSNSRAAATGCTIPRSRPGLPVAVAIAVALVGPALTPLAMAGAAQRLCLQLHQPLRGKADHLAQQCRVGPILQKWACLRQTLGGRSSRPLTHSSYTTSGDTTGTGGQVPVGYPSARRGIGRNLVHRLPLVMFGGPSSVGGKAPGRPEAGHSRVQLASCSRGLIIHRSPRIALSHSPRLGIRNPLLHAVLPEYELGLTDPRCS